MRPCGRRRSRCGARPCASASSGWTSTNGSGRCAPSVGLRPDARHGVPLVAQPAGVEPQRKFGAGRLRAAPAAPARRTAPCGPACEDPAVGEQPRRASVAVRRHRPLHRLERVVVLVRDRGERAEVERARAVILERRQRRMLAEHVGRACDRRTRRANPMRRATSATIHQSGRASPGSGRNARWREMRRSELVTVPSFSPQAAAGSSTCGAASMRVVARARCRTRRTARASCSASRIAAARGSDTAGLVAITHSALISPRSIASNICTALRPSRSAMSRRVPEPAHAVDLVRRETHVRGKLVGEPADLAPAHRVGLAGQRERPHAGLADPAGGEMAIDDGVDLVGALRRLVHALREAGDGLAASRANSSKKRATSPSSRPVAAAVAATSGAICARARERLGKARGVALDDSVWSSAPVSARCTSKPQNSAVSVPGAIGRNRSASSAGRRAARIDHDDLGAALAPVAHHALEQDRMAPGGVRADQHDQRSAWSRSS